MAYLLNALLGRGGSWADRMRSAGLDPIVLDATARDQPLVLTRPPSWARSGTLRQIDAVAQDDPDLPAPFASLLPHATTDAPLVVLGAEHCGGGGFQWAAAWADGAPVFGPLVTATSPADLERPDWVVAPPADMAINAVLRWLGVEPADDRDPFAIAGLATLPRN